MGEMYESLQILFEEVSVDAWDFIRDFVATDDVKDLMEHVESAQPEE